MRRRTQDDGSARLAIPADIAAGPEVRLWAHPEVLAGLDRLEMWPSDKAGREVCRDAIWACMSSARRRWWQARDEWAAEAGFTRREGMAMVPSRRPYWSDGG